MGERSPDGDCEQALVHVVASAHELHPDARVWGSGNWLPYAQREGLDWLTLLRLMGWRTVTGSSLEPALAECRPPRGTRMVILADEPERSKEEDALLFAQRAEQVPLTLVVRAPAAGSALARLAGAAATARPVRSRELSWQGPGATRRFCPRADLEAVALETAPGCERWATLGDATVVSARRVGQGRIVVLGFHPSKVRDLDGAATTFLRTLLIEALPGPAAWIDLCGTLVLRMDDPGGSQNIHLESWRYDKLAETQWAALARVLRARRARLTIGYVPGWADDGRADRGDLEVDGLAVSRRAGDVHPSPRVRYRERASGRWQDYQAEFRGVQSIRNEGLGDVEIHGYAHVHPNRAAWAAAADRYGATSWYRELGPAASEWLRARPRAEHPLELATEALRSYFDTRATTLICPGNEWSEETLEIALALGLRLVSTYYLAIRDQGRFCWTPHVVSPYLDQPSAHWFDAGLPVVACFHDRELALDGMTWLEQWLAGWEAAGARRLVDFRELAGALASSVELEERDGALHLTVHRDEALALVRPLPIAVRCDSGLPPTITVHRRDERFDLQVATSDGREGSLVLPVATLREGAA